MRVLTLTVILFLSIPATTIAFQERDEFIDQIKQCEKDAYPSVCSAKVLVAALRAIVPSGGGGGGSSGIYCKCITQNIGNGTQLMLIKPDELPITIGTGLNPNDCLQALRYYPCTGMRTATNQPY